METQRKYQMTRLGSGDWLLPSNDLAWLWRFRRYTDGPCLGLMDWPSDREVWAVWRTTMPSPELLDGFGLDELPWTDVAGPVFTRRECIDLAMGWDDRPVLGPPLPTKRPRNGLGIGSLLVAQ